MQTDPTVPPAGAWPPEVIYAIAIAVAVLALVAAWIVFKTRRLPGEHVFQASRFSRGNRIFPTQVVVTAESLTLLKPQWIGKIEESIHVAHVSSIKIDTNVLFADIYIESTGGHKPIVCYGHTKGDAVEIKKLLEGFQSTYYRSKA
jgi:hypothetical protein